LEDDILILSNICQTKPGHKQLTLHLNLLLEEQGFFTLSQIGIYLWKRLKGNLRKGEFYGGNIHFKKC
jgi:hypothetical protein